MHAQAQATREWLQKKQIPSLSFGRTGWQVSAVGFGTYRVFDETHARALQVALESGVNLIDTSTNYGDGQSERIIGLTLQSLFEKGTLRREQVVIVSKAGYAQGRVLAEAMRREASGQPWPEMVKLSEDCWHCISPQFLAEQLSASLSRLGLPTLDALLLHNPEYFLKTHSDHNEYYRRIREAFRHLESEVAHGRISCYGVSSNGFPEPTEASSFTSLETLVEIAKEVGGPSHSFKVIQFPFNLLEPGAAFESNNTGRSVTELALQYGLATMSNRPLNAFWGNRMIRLADIDGPAGDQDPGQELMESMKAAMKMETLYPGREVVPPNRIAWAHIIQHNFESLAEIDRWSRMLKYEVRPTLEDALGQLETRGGECAAWAREYHPLAERMLAAFTGFLSEDASVRARRIALALDSCSRALQNTAALTHKVLRTYRAIPGTGCILVGMRQEPYVHDVLNALKAMGQSQDPSPEEAVDAIEAAHEKVAEDFSSSNETNH